MQIQTFVKQSFVSINKSSLKGVFNINFNFDHTNAHAQLFTEPSAPASCLRLETVYCVYKQPRSRQDFAFVQSHMQFHCTHIH